MIPRLEALTGVSGRVRQVANFMKKIGFRRLKVGHIPRKGDPQRQKEFLEKELEPRLKEAKEGKRALLFVDSAHFVHAIFLGFLWVLVRTFIKSSSGRSRFNVLGAIDQWCQLKQNSEFSSGFASRQSLCKLGLQRV
jgi:hypothetical protein